MTVEEFIEYLIDEVASGQVDGKSKLFAEYQEQTEEVSGVFIFGPGQVHIDTQ